MDFVLLLAPATTERGNASPCDALHALPKVVIAALCSIAVIVAALSSTRTATTPLF